MNHKKVREAPSGQWFSFVLPTPILIGRYGHSIEEGQVMNGLWTVILSALAILLTDNLCVRCIDRKVIRSDAKRATRPGKPHCIQRFSSRFALTQLMRFERSKFRKTHRRRCYNGKL